MTMVNTAKLVTPAHRLAALVFTDIVNSTQLKTRLRSGYLKLLERHNELFESGIRESPSAEIIKHTGDGYFAAFATASDAVRFALLFQARMKLEPWGSDRLETRLGIHIGEVVLMDMAGRKDIVGLSADVAARLMSLAIGGQILLTETAFNDARQYVNASPSILGNRPPLRWMAHGRYLIKGTDDPIEVFEVGVENVFPLQPPVDSPKVKRVVPHDQESTLGWRPAMALQVPGRSGWQLIRKLGEGGFGEVWLGEHNKLKELRVFKFCFDAERLRGLKREYMLFRLLREELGRRPDIAALYEVKLDEPPFFLESEYSEGGNLLEWAEHRGGIQSLSVAERIEMVAKVADALAAAHSVGVIHKDIKPSNILIHQSANGQAHPRLADFGISALADRTRLKAHNLTDVSFTEVESSASSNSFCTRMYSPPESMRDTPFTVRGDIYAIGVVLYQMVVGDLMRPLATGWERDIPDPIMRQDIAAIVEGDPDRRIGSAGEVARLLRSQDARREETRKITAEDAARQRRRRMRRAGAFAGAVVMFMLVIGLLAMASHWRDTANELDATRKYAQAIKLEQDHEHQLQDFLLGVIGGTDPANAADDNLTVDGLIVDTINKLDSEFKDEPDINARLRMCCASALKNFDPVRALKEYTTAEKTCTKLYGDLGRQTLAARSGEGYALLLSGDYIKAKPLLFDVFQKQKTAFTANDRDTLTSELLYAAATNNVSGPAAAEPFFKEALALRHSNFSDDDKDTIQSVSAYAGVERDLGNLTEAKNNAWQALIWRQKHFGETAYGTLPSMQTFGLILVDLKQANQGLPLLKTLVNRREQLDPTGKKQTTFRAYSAYGDALCATGDFANADLYYQKALKGFAVRDKGAKPKPKDTLATELGYSESLIAQGKYDAAQPLIQEVFDRFRDMQFAGPRLYLRSEYALAQVMKNLHQPGADDMFKDVLAEANQTLGPDNPITEQYQKLCETYLAVQSAPR